MENVTEPSLSLLQAELAPERILLVDDNAVNLQILSKALQGCGYELLTAKDGKTAIEIAKRLQPSLILLDIIMPNMDGYEVCERLKSLPETENIAIIFLSALDDASDKVKGFDVGGVDYIGKPFHASEVVARVRTHMKIQLLERRLASRNVELKSENDQILNAVSEGIIGLDKTGRVIMMNPSVTDICGWQIGDCIGKKLSEVGFFDVDTVDVSEHLTLPYRSYRSGQAVHSDMELVRCRDNTVLPVAITSTPRAEGGAVVVIRDISDWVNKEEDLRLAREELETQRQNLAHMERLSTTGEMAAGIAHEVNQPLTAISNYSRVAKRILKNDKPDHQQLAEILDKLAAQSARASKVIERMRGYVKKPHVGIKEVSVDSMINEVLTLSEVDSRANDVAVHFEPQPSSPLIRVDIVQMQQVMLNLIRNAMEAMTDPAQRFQGVLITTEIKNNFIYIRVTDRGNGIEADSEGRLFHPFYTTKHNGMGVGLSICQSIVEAHGGEIGYESNPHGGSVFYFSLPLPEKN